MLAKKMKPLVENNSVVRVMFEEGKRLASIYGPENVYDFSIGNPNAPAPACVNQAIIDVIQEEESTLVHGYMSNIGFDDVREAVASSLNRRFDTAFSKDNIIMIAGAADGLNAVFKSILDPGDQVVTFAPYFLEYQSYVTNYEGELVVVSPNTETFQPNLTEFAEKITEKTKAVLINTPHNPTGVVYSVETLTALADIMRAKEKQYGHSILLVSDEPYRELVYDGAVAPFVTKFYDNTVICYSFSKSLSLPGERIGYLVIPNEVEDSQTLCTAIVIANRVLGYVNAPSLMQRVIKRCIDAEVDLSFYDRNRNLLYNSLAEYGFTCIKPQGAFYLFVKSPTPNEKEFCAAAQKHNILVVPGTSFACPGYVRIAYCVAYETIKNALPGFEQLAKEYKLRG